MKKRILSLLTLVCLLVVSMSFALSASAMYEEFSYGDHLYYMINSNGEAIITTCSSNASGELIIPSEIDGRPVTGILRQAFFGCSNLTNVVIPESVVSIGEEAFWGCIGLTSVVIPKSVTKIATSVFGSCDLESLTVAEGNAVYYSQGNCIIETETKKLVMGCNNSVIPEGVVIIGDCAFSGCDGLTGVVIPDSVTAIYTYAFKGCDGLSNIVISNGVTYVGDGAFLNCKGLEAIYCETESQPSNWSDSWLTGCDATVYWDYNSGNRLMGDINNDDEVDKKDYAVLKRYCFGTMQLDEESLLASDVNQDGEVDKKDYAVLKRACFGTFTITPEYVS